MTSPTRFNRKDYRRVKESTEERRGQVPENELRVTAHGGQRAYIAYAIAVLTGTEGKTKHDTINISGIGAAIYSAVNIAEIVKRRIKGLHQITAIDTQTLHDRYEPVEEGKDDVTVDRKVSTITITLSTKQLDKKNPGYQPPLPESEVTEQDDTKLAERPRRPRDSGDSGERGGRGGGERGGRGNGERGGRGGSERGERGGRGNGERGGRGGGERGGRGDGERGGRGGGERGGRGGGERGERGGRGGGERGGRGGGDRGRK